MKYRFFAFLILIAMVSCGDNEDNDAKFSVTIMSPSADDKMVGDSIHLHINFDEPDMKRMGTVNVNIWNIGDNEELYSFEEIIDDVSGHYEHHADVVLDVEPDTDFRLTASVWSKDGDENTDIVESTLVFAVGPN